MAVSRLWFRYVLCLENEVEVTGTHGTGTLQQHDAVMLRAPNELTFTGVFANLVII